MRDNEINWFKMALQKIEKISERHRLADEIIGHKFNIFQLIRAGHEEVQVHSRFLGALLNPQEKHFMGRQFLELFLNEIVNPVAKKHHFIAQADFKLFIEKHIEKGNVDLCLESNNPNQTVIIENKIWAADQDKQISRYVQYAKERTPDPNNRVVLYLSLFGKPPSDQSINGTSKDEYAIISYRDHIIPWLEKCLILSMNKPYLRENINQYLDLLKQLTYKPEASMQNEVKEFLKKNINTSAIKHIHELTKAIDQIQDEMGAYFYLEILSKFKDREDLSVESNEIKFTCELIRNTKGWNCKPNKIYFNTLPEIVILVGFWCEQGYSGLWFSITPEDSCSEDNKVKLWKLFAKHTGHFIKKKPMYIEATPFEKAKIDFLRNYDWLNPTVMEEMINDVVERIENALVLIKNEFCETRQTSFSEKTCHTS